MPGRPGLFSNRIAFLPGLVYSLFIPPLSSRGVLTHTQIRYDEKAEPPGRTRLAGTFFGRAGCRHPRRHLQELVAALASSLASSQGGRPGRRRRTTARRSQERTVAFRAELTRGKYLCAGTESFFLKKTAIAEAPSTTHCVRAGRHLPIGFPIPVGVLVGTR